MTTFPSTWQQRAIDHTDGHSQIVACAGSGKTETIAARTVKLLLAGIKPEEIVAFTFTNRAADELLNRIRTRAQNACSGSAFSHIYPQTALLKCSTMHAYCFDVLRSIAPSYGIYEILSEHQQYALLLTLGVSIGLSGGQNSLRLTNDMNLKCKDEIESFLSSLDIVHNELIDETVLLEHAPRFLRVYESYRAMLERQKILSFGLVIQEAVEHLRAVPSVNNPLRSVKYLFVDEYQDTNTAQEQLIRQFAEHGAAICVVGDDDQCIYEWRGSNVANFLQFSDRYNAEVYELPENRRCQPLIFEAARAVVSHIGQRQDKAMMSASDLAPVSIKRLCAADPEHEATLIVDEILSLTSDNNAGPYACGEIAVLLRSVSASGQFILERLAQTNVPFRLIGSTALLNRPGVDTFVSLLFAWAEAVGVGPNPSAGFSWADKFRASLHHFVKTYFPPEHRVSDDLMFQILQMGPVIAENKRPSVTKALTRVLAMINVDKLDPDLGQNPGLLADLAGITNLVTDVQAVFLRNLAEHGLGDGTNLLNDITWFIVRYASSNYEANLDVDPSTVDAVSVCTVHQAKGLEWPVVFIPSLVEGRFPPSGKHTTRLIPRTLYPHARYDSRFQEDPDPERRLFHVALTRARERLILSDFEKTKIPRNPSVFYQDIPSFCFQPTEEVPRRPQLESTAGRLKDITCTALVEYLKCPAYYRFRRMWQWKVDLPQELGYGTALHHLANAVIHAAKKHGDVEDRLVSIVDTQFHVPYASSFARSQLKVRAMQAIHDFVHTFKEHLPMAETTEQEIVFPCNDVRVACRPDVILVAGEHNQRWIVDLKTIAHFLPQTHDETQILTYALALRFMGIAVSRGSFYSFSENRILDVDVTDERLTTAHAALSNALEGIKNKHYKGTRSRECESCDYSEICSYRTRV